MQEPKRFRVRVLVVLSSALMISLPGFAKPTPKNNNSTTTTTVSSSEDKSDKKSKNTNQAIAQGLSIAESMLLNESPWGISFSAAARRGLDEFADTWASVNTLSLSYRLNSSSALGLDLGYESVLYERDGSILNNQDRDPGRFGVTDMELSYTRPKVWSDRYNRLLWSSSIAFPSSRASQRNSLVAEISTGVALRYQPSAKLIITPSLGTYYRQFRFDTANAMGTQPNSPFGVMYGLSASYVMTRRFIGATGYSQTLRYDFFGDWNIIQSASVRLIYNATDVLNLSVGYNWRDRMITNEPLFDDDRSNYIIGVGYVF